MEYVNGTTSGSISAGGIVNVGHKPRFIYLFYSTPSGNNTYWNYFIYYIPCFNESKGYMAKYRNEIGSSNQVGASAHNEVEISDYITLTDTGFIASKEYSKYAIAY